ncbi:MAG: lysophospholipase [Nitrospira sp.]|nr:alpha/beta hydrolase [Candidatus Manganitrophaceae bacterium]HIL33991.1 alpha/beta hydrolase [Candidatus Manganitrophaceae bacterium]
MMSDSPLSFHLERGSIQSGDIPLAFQSVLPEDPKALLIIVHGISEHKGRYLCLQNDLASAGFGSYAYDQRGFGHSGGKRGHVDRYSDYLHDIKAVITFVRLSHPSAKVFLIGHSLGGLISATFCVDFPHEADGLVLSAPAFDVLVLPWALEKLVRLLNCLLPTLPMHYPSLDGKKSHDPEVDIAFNKDQFVQTKATPRFYVEFRKMNDYLRSSVGKIIIPTLILQGRADRIVRPEGAQTIFDHLKIIEKRLVWYEGFFHEIFNEVGRERVISDLVTWLKGTIDGVSEETVVSD